MHVRRVVTGRNSDDNSVVASDDQVEPITVGLLPGAEFHAIWGSDLPVVLPVDGHRLPTPTWFPPTGGFRFGFVTVPPDTSLQGSTLPLEAALAELSAKLPGMLEVLEPEHPGMHTTDSVDLLCILSGEVWLELDDGAEVRVRAGDSVVQNGTRHAWHNRSSEPCVMAVAMIGTARTPQLRAALPLTGAAVV
jgi:mannose-6-phosphate isomerase-like protein (cupin superfamily)